MSTTLVIVLIGVVILAIALAIWMQKRRTAALRSRFGPEYEQAIQEYGGRAGAEKALERRAERTEMYRVRPLNPEEQQNFSEAWRVTQTRFVDDPPLAIREADHLVCDVMRTKGYPMADFDRRAEDLSVDHAHVVRNYRAAHAIATKEPGAATTEDLRQAMVYYRELFDELLEAHPVTTPEKRR